MFFCSDPSKLSSSMIQRNNAKTKNISVDTLSHIAKFNNNSTPKRLRYETKRFIHTLATLHIKRVKATNPVTPK